MKGKKNKIRARRAAELMGDFMAEELTNHVSDRETNLKIQQAIREITELLLAKKFGAKDCACVSISFMGSIVLSNLRDESEACKQLMEEAGIEFAPEIMVRSWIHAVEWVLTKMAQGKCKIMGPGPEGFAA